MSLVLPAGTLEPVVNTVQLTKTLLQGVLADPKFYKECPLFLLPKTPWTLDPVKKLTAFAQHCVRHYENDPAALQCLHRYLSKKLDQPVDKIRLYYRNPSGLQFLDF